MKKLLFTLLLAAAPALAAPSDLQLFTAYARGTLVIGPDGGVTEVDLTSEGDLGKGVLEGFEQRILAWRFEPITEQGRPVNARAHLSLALVAARKRGVETTTMGIREVNFLDPPSQEGVAAPALADRAMPVFPKLGIEYGVGADMGLVLKLDGQGRVEQVAVERLALLRVGARQPQLARIAQQFRSSAETAARRWTLPGYEPGAVVRMPLRYTPPQMNPGWVQASVQPVELPAWAVAGLAGERVVALDASGAAASRRVKLLTPLDEVPPATGSRGP
ncbi:hypothetical protein [Arenimonas sp. MALMAid1274]|uniref:hypothetical protein n=1 Tax=Arenimonas sp. MALMAid1274 TaxID=3411630 RepID=UPI003B9E8BCC